MRIRANRDSVQRQSYLKGWLHRMFTRKRHHQTRHLFDLTCLVAKQVFPQLSYTPTAYSFHSNHSRTGAQLVFLNVVKT